MSPPSVPPPAPHSHACTLECIQVRLRQVQPKPPRLARIDVRTGEPELSQSDATLKLHLYIFGISRRGLKDTVILKMQVVHKGASGHKKEAVIVFYAAIPSGLASRTLRRESGRRYSFAMRFRPDATAAPRMPAMLFRKPRSFAGPQL